MPRRKQDSTGGKIKIKSSKEINKAIKKGFNKEIAKPLKQTFSKENMGKAEKFLKNEVAPELTTIAIPVASTLAGAAGGYFGGPLGATAASALTQNLMQEYIPKKYQSKNKYTKLAAEAAGQLSSGLMSGEFDPMAAKQLGMQFLDTAAGDLAGKPKASTTPEYHDDESTPYDDLMYQMYSNYYSPKIPRLMQGLQQDIQTDYNALTDAIYKGSDISQDADRVMLKTSPYQQREGDTRGLLGSGLKKKRGRKPRIQQVEIVQRLPYERFSHGGNKSTRQLLMASRLREDEENRKTQNQLNKNIMDMTRYIQNDMDNVRAQIAELERERNFYKEALGAGMRRHRGYGLYI